MSCDAHCTCTGNMAGPTASTAAPASCGCQSRKRQIATLGASVSDPLTQRLATIAGGPNSSVVVRNLRLRPRNNVGAALRAAYIYTVGFTETGDDRFRVAADRLLARVEAATDLGLNGLLRAVQGAEPLPAPYGAGNIVATLQQAAQVSNALGSRHGFRMANEILGAPLEPADGSWAEPAWSRVQATLVEAAEAPGKLLDRYEANAEKFAGGFSDWSLDLFKTFIKTAGAYYLIGGIVMLVILLIWFGPELKAALRGVTKPIEALGSGYADGVNRRANAIDYHTVQNIR